MPNDRTDENNADPTETTPNDIGAAHGYVLQDERAQVEGDRIAYRDPYGGQESGKTLGESERGRAGYLTRNGCEQQ